MAQDKLGVRGFFHVKIVNDDGTFAGDSGYVQNNIMNEGFRQYLVMALGRITGSKYISYLALGTGGTVATDQTAMAGEVGTRTAVTASSTVAGSLTLRLVATFAAGWHSSVWPMPSRRSARSTVPAAVRCSRLRRSPARAARRTRR